LVEFRKTGSATSEKKIRENPEEIFKMVRATLRGLMFIGTKSNQDQVLEVIIKEMKPISRRWPEESFGAGHAGNHEGWFP